MIRRCEAGEVLTVAGLRVTIERAGVYEISSDLVRQIGEETKASWWCPRCNAPTRLSLDTWRAMCGNKPSAAGPRMPGTNYCGEHYLVLDKETGEYITQDADATKRRTFVDAKTHNFARAVLGPPLGIFLPDAVQGKDE